MEMYEEDGDGGLVGAEDMDRPWEEEHRVGGREVGVRDAFPVARTLTRGEEQEGAGGVF